MNNNKGFTLIELLAVLVILIGISMTAVFGISNSLKRREEKECQEQIRLAKNAAKIYFSLNQNQIDVSVETLKKNGYLDNKKTDKINNGKVSSNNFIFTNNNSECVEK